MKQQIKVVYTAIGQSIKLPKCTNNNRITDKNLSNCQENKCLKASRINYESTTKGSRLNYESNTKVSRLNYEPTTKVSRLNYESATKASRLNYE